MEIENTNIIADEDIKVQEVDKVEYSFRNRT